MRLGEPRTPIALPGILSKCPNSFPDITAKFLLESGNFEALISELQAIVIGALDGEGFIWWEANSQHTNQS